MNMFKNEQKTLEYLRELRKNGLVNFDFEDSIKKDIRHHMKIANDNIMPFSKDFFKQQVDKSKKHHDIRKTLNDIIDSIWYE